MATSRQPGPRGIGLSRMGGVRRASDGRGLFVPGAMGFSTAARSPDDRTAYTGSAWFELDAIGVGPDALFMLAAGPGGDGGYRRIEFRSAEQATAAARKLLAKEVLRVQLQEQSGERLDQLPEWTARQLLAQTLHLLWRPRLPLIVSAAAPPAAPPSPVRAAPAPAPAAPAYSTFPPDLDAAAVAQSLISAAQDGVPFCEECQKARAAARADAGASASV
jgi:hypothetical protein